MELISLLLDLVFDNIFFLVIIFSAISFLINKFKGTPSQNQTPRRNTMPPFGGDGPFGGNPMAPAPSTAETQHGRGGMSRGEPAMEAPHSEWQEPARFEEVLEVKPIEVQRPARVSSVPSAPRVRSPGPAADPAARTRPRGMSLHARNAAQGMIWSEVFGPPRAMKQHQLRKR